MNYGTVVNCIDGTIRLAVIEFLKFTWKVQWIVVTSEAAPEKVLSEHKDTQTIEHIHNNIRASLFNQSKKRLAVVSHYGCDINKSGEFEKKDMLRKAVDYLKSKYPGVEVMGIWVGKEGKPMNFEHTIAGEKSMQ
jgi:hypothetical protein